MTLTFRVLPLFPLRLRWEAVIEEFAWDEHFCDGQPKGPFAHWRHCHRLRAENRTSAAWSASSHTAWVGRARSGKFLAIGNNNFCA
jgi:ligand-binding SRPBCC domain-containing protein